MRNLFDEIREGLEAYRDHPDALRQRELSMPDVKSIRKQSTRASLDRREQHRRNRGDDGADVEPIEKGQDLGVDARPVQAIGPLDTARRRPFLVAADARCRGGAYVHFRYDDAGRRTREAEP